MKKKTLRIIQVSMIPIFFIGGILHVLETTKNNLSFFSDTIGSMIMAISIIVVITMVILGVKR